MSIAVILMFTLKQIVNYYTKRKFDESMYRSSTVTSHGDERADILIDSV